MRSPVNTVLRRVARRTMPLVRDELVPLVQRHIDDRLRPIEELRAEIASVSALLAQRLDRADAGLRSLDDQIRTIEDGGLSTHSRLFATAEEPETYRDRLIREILAENPGATPAYEAIVELINGFSDEQVREHMASHAVRYLLSYVAVPEGPGRLLDVWDLISPVLTRFKSWEIETAAPPGSDLERDRLPFEDASIDGVLLCEVIEHFVADPMFCLIEVNRVLRPGGFIVLSTPNAASWFAIYQSLQHRQPNRFASYGIDGKLCIHAREYVPSEVALLLEAAGFGDVWISTRDYGIAPPYRPIPGFDAIHRGETIFCRASKRGPPRLRYLTPIYLENRDFEGFAPAA